MSHMADCKSLAERWCKHSDVGMRFFDIGSKKPLAMSLHDLTREGIDIGFLPRSGTCKLGSSEYLERKHWVFYGEDEEECCKNFLEEGLLRDDEVFHFRTDVEKWLHLPNGYARDILKPKSLEELEIQLSLRGL